MYYNEHYKPDVLTAYKSVIVYFDVHGKYSFIYT